MKFCVPAEGIVGRKMIRIEKRSVGMHGAMFTKLMIELICTIPILSGPMERLKHSSLSELPTKCPYGTFKVVEVSIDE
jgi:hypothetical protein